MSSADGRKPYCRDVALRRPDQTDCSDAARHALAPSPTLDHCHFASQSKLHDLARQNTLAKAMVVPAVALAKGKLFAHM